MSLNVAVVGMGYWGPNLARNFAQLPGANLHTICDLRVERLDRARCQYPMVQTVESYLDLLQSPVIDAIVMATPAETHYNLVKQGLEAGKHVLVEKPLALTSHQCRELINIAAQEDRILMVGHTFLYNAAVRKLKECVSNGDIGEIYYVYASRLNLGRIRHDINAMWNFAPHDLSILMYLLDQEPRQVTAKGYSYIQPDIPDVVFLTLDFPNGVGANIHISWLDPQKVRRMTVVGSERMVIYDDVSAEAKIQIYDKGVSKKPNDVSLGNFETFGEFQLLLRAGDIHIPHINFTEPLKLECSHFVECIATGREPLTDGEAGLQVVRVLEAAQRSLDSGGVPQKIEGTSRGKT